MIKDSSAAAAHDTASLIINIWKNLPPAPPHQKTKCLETTEFEVLKNNSSAMCHCSQKQPLRFHTTKWCHIRSFAVIFKQLRKDHKLQKSDGPFEALRAFRISLLEGHKHVFLETAPRNLALLYSSKAGVVKAPSTES